MVAPISNEDLIIIKGLVVKLLSFPPHRVLRGNIGKIYLGLTPELIMR